MTDINILIKLLLYIQRFEILNFLLLLMTYLLFNYY